MYSERELIQRFRLNREAIEFLSEPLNDSLGPKRREITQSQPQ